MVSSHRQIERCRTADERDLDLPSISAFRRSQGSFPKSSDGQVTVEPLKLAWFSESGLWELRPSFDAVEMYRDSYGYRFGQNAAIVEHLGAAARRHPGKVQQMNHQPNFFCGEINDVIH